MMRTLLAAAAALAFATSAAAAPTPGLLVVHITVADYAKWRPVYDADAGNRAASSATECQVRQEIDAPNEVFVACQFTDLAKAQAFAASPQLRDAMAKSGVQGKPEMWFLTTPK